MNKKQLPIINDNEKEIYIKNVLKSKKLSISEFGLYCALINLSQNGYTNASYKELMEYLNITSRNTLAKYIKSLVDKGLIIKQKGSSGENNNYYFIYYNTEKDKSDKIKFSYCDYFKLKSKIMKDIRDTELNICCEECGSLYNLCLHHVYPFVNIVYDAFKSIGLTRNDYITQEQLKYIENYVREKHNHIELKTLCKECHIKAHKEKEEK